MEAKVEDEMRKLNKSRRSHFDPDVKHLVKVRVVHGSWKKEDRNRIEIEEAVRRYPNVEAITAYMPEAYGTHHSKMAVIFRHDDLAQIVILTGNFIEQDWVMSQAVWKSPLLPLQSQTDRPNFTPPPVGSGERFKNDITNYFKNYNGILRELTSQLEQYNFHQIRAALVASTPGKQDLRSIDHDRETIWGWPGLKRILQKIPTQNEFSEPHIIVQVSSVASVGVKWLSSVFLPALSAHKSENSPTNGSSPERTSEPKFSIIFPTAPEIRRSVNGYQSGGSIHMKTQSDLNIKQLKAIRPMLCRWAGTLSNAAVTSSNQQLIQANVTPVREAHRSRAAPHIKTFVRFSDQSMTTIDWAMVTSANLSTQAWGAAKTANGEVRICSYEVGVIFWPGLWDNEQNESGATDDKKARTQMVPTFGTDTPVLPSTPSVDTETATLPSKISGSAEAEAMSGEGGPRLVGWRMPYDLPLVPYGRDERPWCASQSYTEPDWLGRVWRS